LETHFNRSNDIDDIMDFVWDWFVNDRARKRPGSGTFLQEHAKEMTKKLGKSEFRAFNG
jgi:hypothetical protein